MSNDRPVRVAIAGLGNCAASMIEGLSWYSNSSDQDGLLFPILAGRALSDIEIACAFDISDRKVGKKIEDAIYESPNNFHRIENVRVKNKQVVFRGPTMDGNPAHLAVFVPESSAPSVDVVKILKDLKVDVLVNTLPTGSDEATEFYGMAALDAGCAFINCIPTIFAQRQEIDQQFSQKGVPLIGDDIKSQVGSTILHRSVLNMLTNRGAKLTRSSQINIGGNTDFANFVYRAQTKLVSKYKSLRIFIRKGVPNHIGHHYDPTKGAFKKALFDMEATVFAGSKIKISIQLESDDKPNSSGSIIDLIRIAKYELEQGRGGVIQAACSYYTKSAPQQIEDERAFQGIKERWT